MIAGHRYRFILLFVLFREFEDQNVPNLIFMCHILVMGLAFLLTIVVTAGYVAACENIRAPERLVVLLSSKSISS